MYNGKLYFKYLNSSDQYQLAQYDGQNLTLIANLNATDYGFGGSIIVYNGILNFGYTADLNQLGQFKEGLTLTPTATPAAVCVGSPASLSVTVSGGTGPYSYTWVAPANVQLSATNTKMISATPTGTATGVQTLTVLVADSSSPTLSASATVGLTVNAKPVKTAQPVGATKCVGDNYTLTVTANNAASYQWQKGGVDIAGATSANLVLNALSVNSADTIRVTGAASCNGESLISNEAVLVVLHWNSLTLTV